MTSFSFKGIYPSRRSPVLARNVMATSHPLATQAGIAMLLRGGNAVDAALAAAITLVVVEPTGNGLGSDAFCILWDGEKLHGLNASGKSPACWLRKRFIGDSMPLMGWDSVTVPGAVSAWADLSRKFGKRPFAELFGTAVEYADRGFPVTPVIAEQWRRGAEVLHDQPGFAACFLPEGRTPAAGEIFQNQGLADSLRLIAETHGEAFYRGELASRIADHARAHGAVLDEADLAAHRNEWCGTISQRFAGVELHEIPPNGQGIASLIALGILEHLGTHEFDPDSVEAYHLQIEAMKLAFADIYAYVADPAYMKEVSWADLLSSAYLAKRAKLIDRQRASNHSFGMPTKGGTVCLACADADGMVVSFIQSNFEGFGSGIVVPGTGISLQNRGAGFSLEAGHPNEVGPRKRPFHTIIPGFITRGNQAAMAFGLMGGQMQAQGHLQMTLRSQVCGQDPQTAADAPRWRVLENGVVALEPNVGDRIASGLSDLGHRVKFEAPDENFGFGGAQIVQLLPVGYAAGSDPRKDGQAAGF
jgi:gamma-glutamyltranspeptidase / glutathione hydrolase